MNDQKDENVQEYRREHLEPEIAAMSVRIDEDDENPTLIVNIDDPEAKSAIKRVIIWLGVIGGGIFTWSQRSAREQMVLAMAGTATVATVTTAAVTTITQEEPETRRPAVVAERVVTLQPGPPVTVTVSPKPSKTPPRSESPAPGPAPGKEQPARPTRRTRPEEPTHAPTRTPTPASSPTRSTKPSHSHAPATTEVNSPASRTAQPTTARPATAEPTPALPVPPVEVEVTVADSSGCGGLAVDVDPLLDLCVLG